MLSRSLLISACLFALLPSTPTSATELIPATTLEIAKSSQRAAVVRCTRVTARAVDKYGGHIFTFSEFEVVTPIFGHLPRRFTLRLIGGRVDDVILDAPLVPTFKEGEVLVAMLGPDNRDGYPIVDIQGIYRLSQDASARPHDAVVTSPISGLPLMRAADGHAYSEIPPQTPLRDFVHSLKLLKTKER